MSNTPVPWYRRRNRKGRFLFTLTLAVFLVPLSLLPLAGAQDLTLQRLVTPSTVISKDAHPVTFAIHGFIEFKSLSEAFPYIDSKTRRWMADSRVSTVVRERLVRDLLREAVESRVVSMADERPLEILITHTAEELKAATSAVKEPMPPGYADAFLAVQNKWKHSLNCWSASPSIPGRVLSNWYPIEEGIVLYGATYDSTEHFWQAVKFHPNVTVGQLENLLHVIEQRDWTSWIARLDDDLDIYLPNAYAVEFLRHNLTPDRLRWFRDQLDRRQLRPEDNARNLQQRSGASLRFTAFEEKVLWGDMADLFHLLYYFSGPDDPIKAVLTASHFDAIYLGERKMDERKMGFISAEFRSLMLEIWKVKYLQNPRLREVIASIPMEIRLEHFLNDGDSPDIPIPIYVEYLNQIRELARKKSE